MSEHDVLKKNRNFYIGVGGTVLEGLLSGSLFMLLYSVMQFLWSGQFDMNRVLVLTCVIAVVFLLRILIYSYGYTKAQIEYPPLYGRPFEAYPAFPVYPGTDRRLYQYHHKRCKQL